MTKGKLVWIATCPDSGERVVKFDEPDYSEYYFSDSDNYVTFKQYVLFAVK